MNEPPLILALPKGRILNKVLPLFDGTEFSLKDSLNGTRKILLDTNSEKLKIIVVRGWDVPTYVLAGAAHIGIVGKDILLERDGPMLKYGLQEVNDIKLILPKQRKLYPDRERLAFRFEEFKHIA